MGTKKSEFELDLAYLHIDFVKLHKGHRFTCATPPPKAKGQERSLLHLEFCRLVSLDPSLRAEEINVIAKDSLGSQCARHAVSDSSTFGHIVAVDGVTAWRNLLGNKPGKGRVYP